MLLRAAIVIQLAPPPLVVTNLTSTKFIIIKFYPVGVSSPMVSIALPFYGVYVYGMG